MNRAEIMELDVAGLFRRLGVILDEVKRIDEENPGEETDPRIPVLLDEAGIITDCLDPIMRRRLRHDRAKLAEWDEIIQSRDEIEEEKSADADGS